MDRVVSCSWPGVESPVGCTYTLSHGITPGTAVLRCLPQDGPPAMRGTLTIGDGVNAIVLPDCKLDVAASDFDGEGNTWTLVIVDRRWKWRENGAISGVYNQLDPHGKLIPWTIRSPRELATVCLALMGESGFTLDLPAGLDSTAGAGVNQVLAVGLNFPPSGVNPPVNWAGEIPALALSTLAEQYGRRVVYQPLTDTVHVVKLGIGAALPLDGDVSVASLSPSLQVPDLPGRIGVLGSPTKYQVRIRCEPVGREYDRSFRPINELSYTPLSPTTTKQSDTVTVTGNTASSYQITLNGFFCTHYPTGGDTTTQIATGLAAAVNGATDPAVKGKIKATSAGAVVTITGQQPGVGFTLAVSTSPLADQLRTDVVTVATPGKPTWEFTNAPEFTDVRATQRLTYWDAVRLAQESVFRCYRILNVDVVTGKGRLTVPGFGQLLRRQQLVLLDSQVEQIQPPVTDKNLVDATDRPITIDFYDGYSRDKPARCYGASYKGTQSAFFLLATADENTRPSDPIFVDFAIDAVEQVITFSQPVWFQKPGGVRAAEVILETGCHVLDPVTNAPTAFLALRDIPGGNPDVGPHVERREDVQLFVTADYTPTHTLTQTRLLERDALERAKYYLDGIQAPFLPQAGLTTTYNDILPIMCDGAVQQVTWSADGEGCTTVASTHCEHSLYVPPYPARRRAEALPRDLERIRDPQHPANGLLGLVKE